MCQKFEQQILIDYQIVLQYSTDPHFAMTRRPRHGDFKSPTVAASRSVVAAQSPSCGHTETQIVTDRRDFAFYSKCESFDCTKTL